MLGMLFGAAGLLLFIAIVLSIAGIYGMFASLMFRMIKFLLVGVNEETKLIIQYPVTHPKVKVQRANNAADDDFGTRTPSRNSNFFEDVDGIDLEYRGLGAAEDSLASVALGSAVSQRR